MKADQSSVEHVHLPGPDGFTVWPWAVVRGTGFPAAWVSQLGAPDAALAAELLLHARRRVGELQPVVIERLLRTLGKHPGASHTQLNRALRKVRKRAMPQQAAGEPALPLDDWQQALEALSLAEAQYAEAFEHGRMNTRERSPAARSRRVAESAGRQVHARQARRRIGRPG
jgi:hypothetical protein